MKYIHGDQNVHYNTLTETSITDVSKVSGSSNSFNSTLATTSNEFLELNLSNIIKLLIPAEFL